MPPTSCFQEDEHWLEQTARHHRQSYRIKGRIQLTLSVENQLASDAAERLRMRDEIE